MLKLVCNAVFIMSLCLSAAAGNGEISKKTFLKEKESAKERWLKWLVPNNDMPNYAEELDLARKHFEPLWYSIKDKNGKKAYFYECFDDKDKRFCQFKLNAPLKLKGTLTLNVQYLRGWCEAEFYAQFKSDDFPTEHFLNDYVNLQIKPTPQNQKEVMSKLPQWMKDGLSGYAIYEVEFEVANMSGQVGWYNDKTKEHQISWYNAKDEVALVVDKTSCIKILRPEKTKLGSYLVADKIKLKKIYEKRVEHISAYGIGMYDDTELIAVMKVITKDDFVNIRQTPNGKIIGRINKKDFKDTVLIALPDIEQMLHFKAKEENPKWYKVLYFNPPAPEPQDCDGGNGERDVAFNNYLPYSTIGYIHHSQIEKDPKQLEIWK